MNNIPADNTRRRFLATAACAGSAWLLHPRLAWGAADTDPRVGEIVARTIGIDTHNHIDVPLNEDELPGPDVDLRGELKKSDLTAICMTFAVDYQQLRNPGDGYNRFIAGLDAMDRVVKSNKVKRAFNWADLQAARKINKPVVIQSVEGAHFLEGKLDRLGIAYERGLRHLGLLHDNDASVPLGDIYTKTPQWGGLTTLGADVIRECNGQGILVDLAHASKETIDAALKVATKPVLISHTGLNTRLGQKELMAKMMMPRLISREQAKIVAEAGGVIGVWTHLAETPVEFAENVRALVDVVGTEHVAIGTDTKLTPAYHSPNAGGQGGQRPQGGNFGGPPRDGNRPEGPGGPGGAGGPGGQGQPGRQNAPGGQGGGKPRAGERTNEAWQDQKTGFYYTVVEALLKVGFNEKEIGQIGGGNYCRLFDAATAGH